MSLPSIENILEAALLAAGRAMSVDELLAIFEGTGIAPERAELQRTLTDLGSAWQERSLELVRVSSGYRLQVRAEFAPWMGRLWAERPPRYSRALLETLALIAYRQPVTRGEIEDVRGVSVSSNIIKTLQERDWVRVLGHRDVPGRPALYGTTPAFLDSFGLASLEDLPPLSDIKDLDNLHADLFSDVPSAEATPAPGDGGRGDGAVAGDEPSRAAADGEASSAAADDEPSSAAAGDEPSSAAADGEASSAAAGAEPSRAATGAEPSSAAADDEPSRAATDGEASSTAADDEPSRAAAGDEASSVAADGEASSAAAGVAVPGEEVVDEPFHSGTGGEPSRESAGHEPPGQAAEGTPPRAAANHVEGDVAQPDAGPGDDPDAAADDQHVPRAGDPAAVGHGDAQKGG